MATHAGELRDYDIMKVIKREGRAMAPGRSADRRGPDLGGHRFRSVDDRGTERGGRAEKIVLIRQDNLLPRVTLADPELTLSLPRGLTAGTGMDALSHCLEAYFSSNENPPAEADALDGITRIVANIRTAYNSRRTARPAGR